MALAGCQAPSAGGKSRAGASTAARRRTQLPPPVRRVRCIYEQRPWLNLDEAGDRDPEGIRYRIFLDVGAGRGVLREGKFHVKMYRVDRVQEDDVKRTLVSDWDYPTSSVHTIARPGMLGEGYFLHLRWADKEIAGNEVEIITWFEDVHGRMAKSGTKRLRVPKYTS
jgi:hypothetical protein